MGLRGRLPPPPPPPGPPFPPLGNGGSHQPLAWLLVLVIVLLVGVIVCFAVRYASRPVPPAPAAAAPTSVKDLLALVAFRYANGDITRDEFLRLSADLGGPPVPPAEPPPPDG